MTARRERILDHYVAAGVSADQDLWLAPPGSPIPIRNGRCADWLAVAAVEAARPPTGSDGVESAVGSLQSLSRIRLSVLFRQRIQLGEPGSLLRRADSQVRRPAAITAMTRMPPMAYRAV